MDLEAWGIAPACARLRMPAPTKSTSGCPLKLVLEAGCLETRGLEVAGLGAWKVEAESSRP